jgi:predicted nucleic acid-binding protein
VTLVDTSVWIEVFRSRDPLDLDAVVDFEEVVTTPPVVQEVLQGFREERFYRHARDAMLSLPVVDAPAPLARFVAAADLYRLCRSRGLTVRSSVDCLIASTAIEHDLSVLHRDRDFDLVARLAPLRQRRLP